MKSYKNLWDKFISDENIELAIKNASRGKKDRQTVKRRLENPKFKEQIKKYAENFKNKKHTPKEIYDGIQRKKRSIIVPTFDEQVIHHMVVNILHQCPILRMDLEPMRSFPRGFVISSKE